MTSILYIVHCVDTEGPLYESHSARQERKRYILSEKLNLNVNKKILEYLNSSKTLGNWKEINTMLKKITSTKFRNKFLDSFGGGWRYNWFCMDHVGFKKNPRKRTLGDHKIYDHYKKLLKKKSNNKDYISFHFHPINHSRNASRCATHYLRTDDFLKILCKKIIDRKFFPSSYRAGFQTERIDSHLFLEQFIPYDLSNMALTDNSELDFSEDLKLGRGCNWRNAPADWSTYRPAFLDYQKEGSCKRLISRTLNLNSRMAKIKQRDVDMAFKRTSIGIDTILGISSHDWRDMSVDINYFLELIKKSAIKYPDVKFKFANVNNAFYSQLTKNEKKNKKLKLKHSFHKFKNKNLATYIKIIVTQGEIFGPQPFLAIKTKSGEYIHDNLDFDVKKNIWYYPFHHDTIYLNEVSYIGIAANDILGNTEIIRVKL